MTVFYIPSLMILSLVSYFLPDVWMISIDNGSGQFKNVGDSVALEHASTFIRNFILGAYFVCLNDLQIRFLNAMGKSKIVLVCQAITSIAFVPIGYLMIFKADQGIKGAANVQLSF